MYSYSFTESSNCIFYLELTYSTSIKNNPILSLKFSTNFVKSICNFVFYPEILSITLDNYYKVESS